MKDKQLNINKYLSLRLEGSKTYIYINERPFRQCKYLLLNIPVDDINRYSSVDSIDEIIDNLDHSLDGKEGYIPPEVEFWAHCSNLQAWADYDYNTDLLDSALSFPLLKELTQEGDSQAKKVFKEEIAKRLMRGDINTIGYLIDGKYLEYLTDEEIASVVSSEECLLFEKIFNIFKNGDMDQFGAAESVYIEMGKYFYVPIKKKIQQILESNNLEELYNFLNHFMLDVLTDEQIVILFESPMNIFERFLKLLNQINPDNIKIGEYGLFSRRVEEVLDDIIKKQLLDIIYKKKLRLKYDVLWRLNLLKHIEKENLSLHISRVGTPHN